MIKKFYIALALVLFATSMVAQSGLTCEDAIPVDKSYTGKVDGACELWYTAWTYDLPMHVYFIPDNSIYDYGPEVEIDFTCEYGDYSHDQKLDSVLKILEVMGVTMPVEFMCSEAGAEGKREWTLSIGEVYREQMTEYGLIHNIQAVVKVRFFESGTISLTPDTAFQSCIEYGHYVNLGDTIDIDANDTESVLVLPYSEWQNDSVRFVWIGEESASVWVAEEECQFTPTDANVYVRAKYELDNNTSKKLYPVDFKDAIDNWIGSGIYYAKVLSQGPGRLVVERIPLGEIQGDAILLKHGESIALQANDNRVFCFPKTWKSTEFLANTQYLMAMHVSNTPYFTPGDANVISKYAFSKVENNRLLQLSVGDITSLAKSAKDDYLYVRFVSNRATTLTPSLWNVSSCIEQTKLISSGERFVYSSSDKSVYRMRYEDWADYPFTIAWAQKGGMSVYFASYCNFMTTDPERLAVVSISANSSKQVTKDVVDSWKSSLESDGFIYVRLNSSRQGYITFTSTKPEPIIPDPIYTTISESVCFGESYTWNGQTYSATGEYQQTFVAANGADSIVTLQLTVRPEVPATEEYVTVAYGETHTWNGVTYTESGSYSATLQDAFGCDSVVTLHLTVLPNPNRTELYPNDYMILNLASAFKVFTMEHLSWVAQDVNIHWGGTSPLYVFIASENDFALTPYNRYVLHYEEIAAGGDWVLTASQMASWAQHAAAAGGKVYVRFLTEFEGELTTKGL